MPLTIAPKTAAPAKKTYRVPVGYCVVCNQRTMATSDKMALEHKNTEGQTCDGTGTKVTKFEVVW